MSYMDGTKSVMRPGVPVTATPSKVEEKDDYVVAFYPADEWAAGSKVSDAYDDTDVDNDVDNDADNDADNIAQNLAQNVTMQDLLHILQRKFPANSPPVGHGTATGNAYDVREFVRSLRGNWKIIAPVLTAASGVAAVALLTVGARGSISGTQLSHVARWSTWIAGYLMTQATILVGAHCIPPFQCR